MESPLLEALPDDDRRELVAMARRRKFAAREVVFHEGDPGESMHIVVRGHLAVKITTPMGEVATLRVLREGEFFGELALIAPGPRNATVVAVDPAETLSISKAVLDDLRASRPAVAAVITEALVQEVRRLSVALVEALYLPADKRVLQRLLDLSGHLGRDDTPVDVVPVTQSELAELAGVTRETANRVLQRSVEHGALALTRGKVEILDRAALIRQAR